ncbi:MAG: hypothetical protein A2770_04270 [Candidatus Levybacteria bacterium RIFCSPHIGHO2_01_FULL_38_12]|nr:MAG: hypothetical protein A2770_04270 [Candidatus Levybacteria bacterium RIFCSPHIGHO2_01_FULL_38_12]
MKTSTKSPIVILHGWGRELSGGKYDAIKQLLGKKGYTVYTPDFPGFGASQLGKTSFEFEDYVSFVNEFITKNKLKKVVLLGHSFGGRVAIRFATEFADKVDLLILTGASGIPRPLSSLKKKIVFVTVKILRPLFLISPISFFFRFFRKLVYYSIDEMDYYKAGNLSKTFKNVYQVSILPDLPKIKVRTLLVWGEEDKTIPLIDAKEMELLIPRAKLVVVKNEGHRLPYENPQKFMQAIESFL